MKFPTVLFNWTEHKNYKSLALARLDIPRQASFVEGKEDDHEWYLIHTLAVQTHCEISCKSQIIYLLLFLRSIYIKMGVQMFVCLLVCGGLMEIQTPAPIFMKFCTHIPACPRKDLMQVWPPTPSPWSWGPKTLRAEGHIFWKLLLK